MEQDNLLRYMMQEKMEYDKCKSKNNTYPWECVDTCKDMKSNNCIMNMEMKQENNYYEHKHHHQVPIQHMGPQVYAYVYEKVLISVNKYMLSTKEMPKAISKDDFNMMLNDCMCTITKEEDNIKSMLKSRCVEGVGEDRVFCPYCGGLLKSVAQIALISSLINKGCAFCF